MLRRNIAQFVRAVAEHMGNQLEGDQLGPILAGAYSLVSGKEVMLDEARAFVKKRDWDEHKLSGDDNDGNLIWRGSAARRCAWFVRKAAANARLQNYSELPLTRARIR